MNKRDQYHEQALALATAYEGHPLVVTEAVFLEIANGLARSYRREAVIIIEQFSAAQNVEIVPLTSELFGAGFALYRTQQGNYSGLRG